MSKRKDRQVYSQVKMAKYDISAIEIAENTDIHHDTVIRWLNTFNDKGIVKQTRKVGNATFYDIKRQ